MVDPSKVRTTYVNTDSNGDTLSSCCCDTEGVGNPAYDCGDCDSGTVSETILMEFIGGTFYPGTSYVLEMWDVCNWRLIFDDGGNTYEFRYAIPAGGGRNCAIYQNGVQIEQGNLYDAGELDTLETNCLSWPATANHWHSFFGGAGVLESGGTSMAITPQGGTRAEYIWAL